MCTIEQHVVDTEAGKQSVDRKQYTFEKHLCKINLHKITAFSSRALLIKLAILNYLLYTLSMLISYINCNVHVQNDLQQ